MVHLDSFLAYHNHPEVIRFQSWEPFTRAQGEAFVREQMAMAPLTPGTWTQLAVERIESGMHIGDVAVHIQADDPRLCELGVTLDPSYHGQGYASEALRHLITYLVQIHAAHRIVAEIDPRNTGSITLFERLEFRREGHLRQNLWLKGEWVDTLVYAVLAREWPGSPTNQHAHTLD